MDFLSLHCLPVACLPGRGTFSHTDASVLPSSRLPPWAGVSASSPSSGPLLTLVLPSSTPFADLLWARLRPGASRLPALADAHCRLFRPPRLLLEPSRGPVRGWVLATGTWGGGGGGLGGPQPRTHDLPPGRGRQGAGVPSEGESPGWAQGSSQLRTAPTGRPRPRAEFVLWARAEALKLTVNEAPRGFGFLPQDHPRAEYEARVLEKSLRKESKSKEVRQIGRAHV